MHKLETHFIAENIAPVGARNIVVMATDADGIPTKMVGTIPLGGLDSGLKKSDMLYNFCALSDVHVEESKYPTSTEDFQRALTYANANCAFTCIAGDLVEIGVEEQLANYARLVEQYSPDKPVYAIAGNHENYNDFADGTNGLHLQTYTGHPLYYSFERGDDVFVMVGHFGSWHDGNWQSDEFISTEELQWLYETLEVNRNKRCFVFCHVLPFAHGVGDPCGLYTANSGSAKLWNVNDGGIGQAFINLLTHYKNTILFHGHSHTRFSLQELDPKANYAEVKLSDGRSYKSVHIPSLAVPRDDVNGTFTNQPLESEGYIVGVYPDCIILNGRDFVDNDEDGHWIPIGTYKIDTTLQTVVEGTFVDSTGLIKT